MTRYSCIPCQESRHGQCWGGGCFCCGNPRRQPGRWRKSSFSFSNGACIEVAEVADWRKPSRSYGSGMCVEVASGVVVRDTQDREGPVLKFSAAAWRAFTAGIMRQS